MEDFLNEWSRECVGNDVVSRTENDDDHEHRFALKNLVTVIREVSSKYNSQEDVTHTIVSYDKSFNLYIVFT